MFFIFKKYPDIKQILLEKIRGRQKRATLSFAEKIILLDRLRERVAPIIHAREVRARRRS